MSTLMRNLKLWLLAILVLILALLFGACAPTAPAPVPQTPDAPSPVSPTPPAAPTPATEEEVLEEPALPGTLKRDCPPRSVAFENAGLQIGGKAVNFTLKDINGEEFRLSRLLAEKPVMMVFGSFT